MRLAPTVFLLGLVLALPACTSVPASRTFGGFRCTKDCTGHSAGYRWASRNPHRIEECVRETPRSFREGCLVFDHDPRRGWQTDDAGQPIASR